MNFRQVLRRPPEPTAVTVKWNLGEATCLAGGQRGEYPTHGYPGGKGTRGLHAETWRQILSGACRIECDNVPSFSCLSRLGWPAGGSFSRREMTTDRDCIGIVIYEATNALDRRHEELSKMPSTGESRKEGEEILRAAKRLLLIRAEAQECDPTESQ
jgi:hypothetical protein